MQFKVLAIICHFIFFNLTSLKSLSFFTNKDLLELLGLKLKRHQYRQNVFRQDIVEN